MIGRRVASFDEIERAGDYYGPTDQEGAGRTVWFLLPLHAGDSKFDHPEGSGLHGVNEPPWVFRECPDGSLEIRESILCGKTEDRPEGYWHGFLDEGHSWRQV